MTVTKIKQMIEADPSRLFHIFTYLKCPIHLRIYENQEH